MRRYIAYTTLLLALVCGLAYAGRPIGKISPRDTKVRKVDNELVVKSTLSLDSLHLGANNQIYVTPIIESPSGQSEVLPSVLVNGRNMHYAYERGSMRRDNVPDYKIGYEVRRHNGKPQSLDYKASVPAQSWMLDPSASIRFVVDTCGCGHAYGSSAGTPEPLGLNPAPRMRLTYITPAVTEQPVAIHEGQAQVQYEVDRTELHAEPYVCRNGRRIDNRAQLAVIEDSVRYALSDPNVEIARINICGYASPESPYMHNEELASGRSRSLSEYIGKCFQLPADKSTYTSVPENWVDFRKMVTDATDITEAQRRDLLELIDRPAYGASDYDAKERELKTSPKFAALYRSKILPDWFPKLRCTKFEIRTRLKPTSDQKLAELIETHPQMLSLNQMFRVARLYPEGSAEFNHVIAIARKYYPDDTVANLNAAVAALKAGELKTACEYLSKAGDSPEAENARGVLAAAEGNFEQAIKYFDAAGNLPEALKNKALLEE